MLLCSMKTLKDVFVRYHQRLDELYSVEEAESITLLVINEITGFSKAKIKAFPEIEVSNEKTAQLEYIATELSAGKPLQYVLGHTEFYGLLFKVNSSVLIPRPETEELVEWVLSSADGSLPVRVLDVGTGSGCIAVAVKKNLAGANVTAIDISAAALRTAKENALLNNAEVDFMQADILSPGVELNSLKFDIIISNPPYVTLADKMLMHRNVTDFEPHTALFVPENDPLIFYKAIAFYASVSFNSNGFLFFEINEGYGDEVVSLLQENRFENVELRKDMSGRDRMVKAFWPGENN
jgi:release factor glutamine methyltransferase